MSGDDQETDVATGFTHLRSHSTFSRLPTRAVGSDIDNRYGLYWHFRPSSSVLRSIPQNRHFPALLRGECQPPNPGARCDHSSERNPDPRRPGRDRPADRPPEWWSRSRVARLTRQTAYRSTPGLAPGTARRVGVALVLPRGHGRWPTSAALPRKAGRRGRVAVA